MLADELNFKWHKEWRKQVVDAFVVCRDVDMGEHVEIPLADWEMLQKALMQAPSRTLPFVETVEKIFRGSNDADNWHDIETCPKEQSVMLWVKSTNNSEFGRLAVNVHFKDGEWYGRDCPMKHYGEYAFLWQPMPAPPIGA